MNKKEKIVCGICGIVLTAGSFIVGNIKGYNDGNIDGKATGIYQTIKNLHEMNMLFTSKGNTETAIQGTAIYRSLLKDSRFKGYLTDKRYVNIKEDIKNKEKK